jgi:hypothetical protein
MREGVVDHQMLDVLASLCVMPALATALEPATRNAREEVKSAIWLTKRRLDTLAGVEQVDRLLRKVAGTLGRDQDQRAAAIRYPASRSATPAGILADRGRVNTPKPRPALLPLGPRRRRLPSTICCTWRRRTALRDATACRRYNWGGFQ